MNRGPLVRNIPQYSIAAIRELLHAAFTAEELRRFCQDRPNFRPIMERFGPGLGFDEMVDRVVDYCEKQQLFDELLVEVKEVNPRQYGRFEADLPISAEALAKVPCPYRGLKPFEAVHAEFYFGREAMVKRLVAKVKDRNLVAVVGPSGCGKSSLVQAGLVTVLRDGALPGSQDWGVRIFRPGADPLWALSRQLIALLEPEETTGTQQVDAARQASALRDGALSMNHIAADLRDTRPDIPSLLLVADQFEELYTECHDEALRQAFVGALMAAAEEENITVVLTLRADFYGRVLDDRRLGEAVDAGLVNMLPMNEDELRAAIEHPALKVGRTFEPGLVKRILEDVVGEPGSLPLLEFALTELWTQQTVGGLLTHEAYQEIGQVEGAIAKRAEATYEEFEKKGQAGTVRRIFLRLIHYGKKAEGTRRRATVDDLVTPRTPRGEIEPIVKALADARLVVTSTEEGTTAAVEVSHEALIQGWERLRQWLNDDQAFGLWREKLEAARGIGVLLRDAPLAEAEGWLARRGDDLNDAERAFIQEGLDLRAREADERQEQQRKEAQLAAEQRTAGRLRRLARGLGVSVLIAVVLAGVSLVLLRIAVVQRDARATEVAVRSTAEAQAEAAREEADGLKLVFASLGQSEKNHELALLLAIEAGRTSHSLEADSALRSSFLHRGRTFRLLIVHKGPVNHAAWSPDGKRILTTSSDGMARVWDAESGAELAVLIGLENYAVGHAAWSPDGKHIVTAGCELYDRLRFECARGMAQVWALTDGIGQTENWVELAVLTGHEDPVNHAAWSPDGKRLVTSSSDGTARVWALADGIRQTESWVQLAVLTGHEGSVNHAAWNMDGKRIVTSSSDGTARVWALADGIGQTENWVQMAVLTGHGGSVNSAAWNPDGKRIVTSSSDGTARVWDVKNEAELVTLPNNWGGRATWSPDGARIVTAGNDRTARVWDAESGAELAILAGHTAMVRHAAWSPDGTQVLTASPDGTARVWDAETGVELAVLTGHEWEVSDAAWSPDGRRIVTTSWDGTARVWDMERGGELAILAGHTAMVKHAAWSPDGTQVLTASSDGTARVWDAETGVELAVLAGHAGSMNHAAWSPDGRRIVTASSDGTARVWGLADGIDRTESWVELGVLTGHEGSVRHAAWSPDGKRIVTAGEDGTARVWVLTDEVGQAESTAELAVLTSQERPVEYAAWSPDGKRIVTEGGSTARVWGLTDEVGQAESWAELAVLSGHEWVVWHVAWSPDGRRIVTASGDGTARVWDAETGTTLAVLTGHEKYPDDWVWHADWDPGGERIVTSGEDRTARVWDAQTGMELTVLSGHEGPVHHVVWSPDGQRILTASDDGTARVWDAETGVGLAVLSGHEGPVNQAAWGPDGRRIVTAGEDGTARVYYAQIEDLLAAACGRAVRNMSEKEWRRYMSNQSYRETCPNKPVPGRDF